MENNKKTLINYLKTNHVNFLILKIKNKNVIAIDLNKISDMHFKYIIKACKKWK